MSRMTLSPVDTKLKARVVGTCACVSDTYAEVRVSSKVLINYDLHANSQTGGACQVWHVHVL